MLLKYLCKSVSESEYSKLDSAILINTSDVLDGKVLHNKYSKKTEMLGQFKKTFKSGDILFSEIRPQNKRFAFINFEQTSNYIVSTKLMVIRNTSTLLLPKYLYLFLTHPKTVNTLQVGAESRSGTFPQITFDENIGQLDIKILPIEDQQHIVDTIIHRLTLFLIYL